jgi:hypothetical protein
MNIYLTENLVRKYSKMSLDNIQTRLLNFEPSEETVYNYQKSLHKYSHCCPVQCSPNLLNQLEYKARNYGLRASGFIVLYLISTKQVKQLEGLSEKWFQDHLVKEIGGVTEFPVRIGRIDIISGKEIIEVKYAKDWKHAVGQALCYALEFGESYAPCLALIGAQDFTIEALCKKLGIRKIYWLTLDKNRKFCYEIS